MIDAVVIVLREVLEAMLVCCVLLASSYALGAKRIWLLPVTLAAVGGALLYATNLATLTALFDGRGQELTNVLLLVLTGASLLFYLLQLPAMLHNKRSLGKKGGLPADIRKGLSEAMREATIYNNQISREKNEEARKAIIDSGKAKVVKLTDAQLAEWKKAVAPVYAQFEKDIGVDLIKSARTLRTRIRACARAPLPAQPSY